MSFFILCNSKDIYTRFKSVIEKLSAECYFNLDECYRSVMGHGDQVCIYFDDAAEGSFTHRYISEASFPTIFIDPIVQLVDYFGIEVMRI